MKNIKNFQGIVIENDVILDLNGCYIAATSAVDGAVIVIDSGATVKLTDSRSGGYVKVEYSAWQKFMSVIQNNGTLTVEKVTLNGANLNNTGAAGIINDGTLTLDVSAVITVKKAAELQNNGTFYMKQEVPVG